jgi:hypothetical protein
MYITGIEPGSVVITEAAVDGLLRPYMEVVSVYTNISLLILMICNSFISLIITC